MYSCNRFYNDCAFHKQTNSALLFPLRGYCREGCRQKRSCAVLKYSAVPRRDTQMKCCSSTQVRHTSVDQQTAQTIVPWQQPVCIKVRAPSLHRLLIRACWQIPCPTLRTPCTSSFADCARMASPLVLAFLEKSESLSSCSLFWRKAAGLLALSALPIN